jgi:hypothetical protein
MGERLGVFGFRMQGVDYAIPQAIRMVKPPSMVNVSPVR